jgi:hypothetical protein
MLALLAAGCGGGGGKESTDTPRATEAIAGLYAIDHDGARPKGNALDRYRTPFERVQEACDWVPATVASQVANLAQTASNGSGTRITNLDALHAVVRSLPGKEQGCAGLFVGVEAELEGAASAG